MHLQQVDSIEVVSQQSCKDESKTQSQKEGSTSSR
jgi:hypothetical protein